MSSIGASHGKSGVQVSLRWIWQNDVAVTTKSGNKQHLIDDLDIFDWMLTDHEQAMANSATSPAGKPSFMCDA